MVSSALPSLLREIQSQLLFFHDSNRWVKRELAAFYVKACFAFFPQEFHIIILYLGLYLEFIFVYAVREYSNFILIS